MFTLEEIDILIEALKSWENEGSTHGLLTAMLSVGLGADKDEAIEDAKAQSELFVAEKKKKEYQSIMIKAKLIKMRDEIEAKEFGNSVLGG